MRHAEFSISVLSMLFWVRATRLPNGGLSGRGRVSSVSGSVASKKGDRLTAELCIRLGRHRGRVVVWAAALIKVAMLRRLKRSRLCAAWVSLLLNGGFAMTASRGHQ